ncbi:MAG: D-alanine--D-alanine ligase [Eubacteriales bacterium]|nr:D-alanine--D-alanine ligase [Eubacteriales bacterium]
MSKLNVCVLFGGVSSEHDVSLITAKGIIDNLDREKYNVYPVGITKDGRWLMYSGDSEGIPSNSWLKEGRKAIISPDRIDGGLITDDGLIKIDVVYLALHGKNGEDGTIQGLLEIAGIKYTGAGVLSSALCMDKAMTKVFLGGFGIPQAEMLLFINKAPDDMVEQVEGKFTYPVFVKPSNGGSSCGAYKVRSREQLISSVNSAFEYDTKVMVEEYINAYEVECGILGNEETNAGSLSKIVIESETYDYETKYTPGMAFNEIPAKIPQDKTQEVVALAKKIYTCLDASGYGRVDFFMEKATGKILFNELNSLPGFTPFSAYPGMWEDKGVSFSQLLDKIITLALDK